MNTEYKPTDFSQPQTAQTEDSAASGRRLKEILKVLKKHHLPSGLTPEKLRKILEDLGPTYVKLGQIMSMRSDMLPEVYCRELTRLRTDVVPMPYETVLSIIESELNCPAAEIFASIESAPLGSASIAQVHPAQLKDGTRVVLKVQRPAIWETMENDIRLLKKASGLLKLTLGTNNLIDFNTILDELWKTTKEEIDFKKEAANLELFYANQKDIVYTTCPKVYSSLTTPRLLVMDFIDGIQIDHIEELTALGYDMTEIGEKTAENYCKQILEDGFFHADPHPENLWISKGQIAWLDLGMAGHLSSNTKLLLRKAITALLENDIYSLKNVLLAFAEPQERVNHARLYTDIDDIVSKYVSMDFGTMRLGDLLERLLQLVKDHRLAITPDITLLARSMITIEGTLSTFAPDVNLLRILSIHMSNLLFHELNAKHLLKHKGRQVYTSLDKSLNIPAQLSDLLNITKNGQAQINLQLSDGESFRRDVHSITNRILLTVLTAALFIGSGLASKISTIPKWFGIPWIGCLGYGLSALLFLILLIQMFRQRR